MPDIDQQQADGRLKDAARRQDGARTGAIGPEAPPAPPAPQTRQPVAGQGSSAVKAQSVRRDSAVRDPSLARQELPVRQEAQGPRHPARQEPAVRQVPRRVHNTPMFTGPVAAAHALMAHEARVEPASDVAGAPEVSGLRARARVLETRMIMLARPAFVPAARLSIFVVYFWFGFLKLIGLSPATPLATALTAHPIGLQYFPVSFKTLAIFEMGLGVMFLVPALTRVAVALLLVHLAVVSSPLVLVASDAWTHPLVPTFEGQYIIKDVAIFALAVGILGWNRMSSRNTRQAAAMVR
jgi:uncharacterized membrane protein YkgB